MRSVCVGNNRKFQDPGRGRGGVGASAINDDDLALWYTIFIARGRFWGWRQRTLPRLSSLNWCHDVVVVDVVLGDVFLKLDKYVGVWKETDTKPEVWSVPLYLRRLFSVCMKG